MKKELNMFFFIASFLKYLIYKKMYSYKTMSGSNPLLLRWIYCMFSNMYTTFFKYFFMNANVMVANFYFMCTRNAVARSNVILFFFYLWTFRNSLIFKCFVTHSPPNVFNLFLPSLSYLTSHLHHRLDWLFHTD